jgi:DNA ligase (NAD+)
MTKYTIDDLKDFDCAYYNGESVIQDSVYDAIREEVRMENPNHPYFNSVGASSPSHLSQVKLHTHMGSQQKVNTADEIRRWYESSIITGDILVMEKLDGSSVELTYENGVLQRVATRGDGTTGTDITNNARRWKNIPLRIPVKDRLIIRGEAMLLVEAWKNNFPGTANPRNAANGTIMRKSGENNEHIMVTAFDCDCDTNLLPDRIDARLLLLQDLGFDVVPCMICQNISDLNSVYAIYRDKTRSSLEYEIDGLILSCIDKSTIVKLGYRDGGSRPRGQAAIKFPPEKGETTVKAIHLTIGHTGALIPTAELEPVRVGGITVSNVLLNNQQFIRDLGVDVGDKVLIERAGDVIPYMSKVVEKQSTSYFQYPSHCPYCGESLAEDGRAILCVNSECEGKSFQVIKNWVRKLDIKHLGESLLRVLYDTKMVQEIPDLYDLNVDSIKGLNVGNGALGKSMAEKVMKEIDKTREIPISLFMGSVSIKFLGRSMADHIGLHTPEEYFSISAEGLSKKDNMGVNKANMMKESIEIRKPLIERILQKVKISKHQVAETSGDKFSGMVVIFTGVRLSKEDQALFETNGGVIKDSVSKNATHLVQKLEDSESSKSKKAKSLGLKVISLQDFLANLATARL